MQAQPHERVRVIGAFLWPRIRLMPTDDVYGRWAASGEVCAPPLPQGHACCPVPCRAPPPPARPPPRPATVGRPLAPRPCAPPSPRFGAAPRRRIARCMLRVPLGSRSAVGSIGRAVWPYRASHAKAGFAWAMGGCKGRAVQRMSGLLAGADRHCRGARAADRRRGGGATLRWAVPARRDALVLQH